jgi:hypothetical protein
MNHPVFRNVIYTLETAKGFFITWGCIYAKNVTEELIKFPYVQSCSTILIRVKMFTVHLKCLTFGGTIWIVLDRHEHKNTDISRGTEQDSNPRSQCLNVTKLLERWIFSQ